MRLFHLRSPAALMPAILVGLLLVPSLQADEEKAPVEPKTSSVEIEDIKLQVPENWVQQKPANRLRLAQFEIAPVDGDKQPTELVISFFGGGGGGVAANVERWIAQFHPDGREVVVTQGKSEQGEYVMVDLSGTYNKPIGPPIQQKTEAAPSYRMLGLILNVKNKGNYFLKLTGPEKTVESVAETLRASIGAKSTDEKELDLEQ